ncbi:MAG: EVE domain-containing protein [Nanoarchaeota archaeon]|nr:EVE domain-containing protein [Nanoarchaeota archaeon]
MNYYVFQIADFSDYSKQRKSKDVFEYLVKEKSVWGLSHRAPFRKLMQAGDYVLFYLTGQDNQVFVGAATLKNSPYRDDSAESKSWFLDPYTLRVDLVNIVIFSKPIFRKKLTNINWVPYQGGSNKITEKDYLTILSYK